MSSARFVESRFPGDREAVYLLVNRDPHANSTTVTVEGMRHAADCYSGQRLTIREDSTARPAPPQRT